MRYLLVIGFLTFSILIQAQLSDTINQVNENGLKQGYWQKNYPNGKPIYKGFFKNGKPNGVMKRYFDNGELKAIIKFPEEGDSVYAELYYNNGKLFSEGNYVRNRKEGEWKFYSYYDNTLKAIVSYKNGMKHGNEISYYPNGTKAELLQYNMGSKNGKWEQYFATGEIKQEATYVNEQLHGAYVIYYPSRLKYVDGTYYKNLMDGTWYYFDEDGQIEYKAIYNKGMLENPEELEKEEQQFFKNIEHNKGKYSDPTIEDVMPM